MNWGDACNTLGLKPDATQQEIKAKYRWLAGNLHPDKFQSSEDKEKANETLKRLNQAYEILQDPSNRLNSKASNSEKAESGLLDVFPNHIQLKNAEPGAIQYASFILNYHGDVSGKSLSVKEESGAIVRKLIGRPLSRTSALPVKVDIEAIGQDCGQSYEENINIFLNDKFVSTVKLELQTKQAEEPFQHTTRDTSNIRWFRLGFTTNAIIVGVGLGYYFNVPLLSIISTVIVWVILSIVLYIYWQDERVRIILFTLSVIPICSTLAIISPGFIIFQIYPVLRAFATRISSAFGGAILAGLMTHFVLAEPLSQSKNKTTFLLVATGIAILALVLGIRFAS